MSLPAAGPDQNYVKISPFAAGHITLPEYIFYAPSDPDTKVLVPSMSFLIQHPNASLFGASESKQFRMLFDLGVRSEPSRYVPVLQKHIKSRSPIHHRPSARDTLEAGGLAASDIDAIAISHVHWDHHGDPEDFPDSTFLLGPGAKSVLAEGLPGTGNHSVFDPNLYKGKTVVELPTFSGADKLYKSACCPKDTNGIKGHTNGTNGHSNGTNGHSETNGINGHSEQQDRVKGSPPPSQKSAWKPLGPFPHTLDLLGDGSVYIVSAPGHLPGHINMLCRTGPKNWVYLGGDTFHDRRMLTGEKWITTYADESGSGKTCCIHIDKEAAQESLERVGKMMKVAMVAGYDVEPVVAHDVVWFRDNRHRLFPNTL